VAFGQSAQSSMKTIGTPSAALKPEIVPSLFVLNSRGATLQGDTLVLTGVTPCSIIFADRPYVPRVTSLLPKSLQNGARVMTVMPRTHLTQRSPY
jgi:hypothetical protein